MYIFFICLFLLLLLAPARQAQAATYSFLDVMASIAGPGGSFSLRGANVEEGITVEPTGDKNIMTIGADGAAMHSLRADESGTVTIRLLKTSTINAMLQQLYNSQTQSGATHGHNTISIKNIYSGDDITCTECAFASESPSTYATEGGIVEWSFHAGHIKKILGTGGTSVR